MPYAYCANNPVNKIDPYGELIYTLVKDRNKFEFWEAIANLLGTEDGRALWDHYASSGNEDIYMGVGTYGSKIDGATIKDGKINTSNIEKNKELFSIFNGMYLSRSKGHSVSLISLNDVNLEKHSKESNPYENAETIYHEMYAHVKIGCGSGEIDHDKYGNYKSGMRKHYDAIINYSGNMPSVDRPAWDVKRGTPYYRILQQLTILKNKNEKKK